MPITYNQNRWPGKPTGPVQLNRNHPQTRGLIGFWPVLASDGYRLKNLAPKIAPLTTAGATGDALPNNGYKKYTTPNGAYAALLNGTNQRFTVQGNFPGSSITFAFRTRLKVVGTGTTDNNEFIERGTDSSTWGFQMSLRGPNLTFLLVNQVPAAVRLNGSTALVINRWYHVAATYDLASQTGCVYLDGKLDGTATMAATSIRFTPDILSIGATDGSQRYVNGTMDDIRVYNRALSAYEISDVYQNPTAVFANQNKIMYSDDVAGGPAFNPTQFFMVM